MRWSSSAWSSPPQPLTTSKRCNAWNIRCLVVAGVGGQDAAVFVACQSCRVCWYATGMSIHCAPQHGLAAGPERTCLQHQGWTWELLRILFSHIPGEPQGQSHTSGAASPEPSGEIHVHRAAACAKMPCACGAVGSGMLRTSFADAGSLSANVGQEARSPWLRTGMRMGCCQALAPVRVRRCPPSAWQPSDVERPSAAGSRSRPRLSLARLAVVPHQMIRANMQDVLGLASGCGTAALSPDLLVCRCSGAGLCGGRGGGRGAAQRVGDGAGGGPAGGAAAARRRRSGRLHRRCAPGHPHRPGRQLSLPHLPPPATSMFPHTSLQLHAPRQQPYPW